MKRSSKMAGWVAAAIAAAALVGCGLAGCTGRSASSLDAGIPPIDGGPRIDAGTPPVVPGYECGEVAVQHASVGCEYWPTVTANGANGGGTHFAVLVANPSEQTALVEVLRGEERIAFAEVPANDAATIVLPWVAELVLPPIDFASLHVRGGAYRLRSSLPVVAYQFNPLEGRNSSGAVATNDASLLLPTHALGTTIVATGWSTTPTINDGEGFDYGSPPSFLTITATEDATLVRVRPHAAVRFTSGALAAAADGWLEGRLDRADVVQLMTDSYVEQPDGTHRTVSMDPSGTLIVADHPVQVITGNDCLHFPAGFGACDHVEESVFPATSLGTRYVVPQPTGPGGAPVEHGARIVGLFDATELVIEPAIAGAPATIGAGEVVDLGVLGAGFELGASQPVAVVTMLLGAEYLIPEPRAGLYGDPSLSVAIPTDQFRDVHIFLAPATYERRFVDVVAPAGTEVRLDGEPVPASETIGAHAIHRAPLDEREIHRVEGSAPVSVQVLGYDYHTSFAYPGGLHVAPISPPPLF